MTLLETTLENLELCVKDPRRKTAEASARLRLEALTMPYWAMGRILDLAQELAEMTGTMPPAIERKTVVIMAGDHGVTAEGTSKYPSEVTVQMVHNFMAGGAGINALAGLVGARVVVVDMGVKGGLEELIGREGFVSRNVAKGTANMTRGPAMDRDQALQSIESGIGVALELADSTDVFGTGDMGIGNTTPSSAIASVICGAPVEAVTGRGTGLGDEELLGKVAAIEKAIEVNRPNPEDGVDVLAGVGGFEIGGIAGLIIGAASLGKPVLIDGFISTAGALIAAAIAPAARRFMVSAHQSAEPGHIISLKHLRKKPLLTLDMRLGEGTGAALAMHLVDAARSMLLEVATFEEASVSKADD